MNKKQLTEALSHVQELIQKRPWWQKNLLDEAGKTTGASRLEKPHPEKQDKA